MTIRRKTIVLSLFLLVSMACIIVPYTFTQLKQLEKISFNTTVSYLTREIDRAIISKKDVWLTNAMQIALNPTIILSFTQKDREMAVEMLNKYSEQFKKNTNFRNVRVHLIDVNINSYVKSWDFDSFGESLDYSPGYKYVLSSRKPLVTMEYAPNGLMLKGLFPIMNGDILLGIVNFEGGLNSIKRDFKANGIDFLYLINSKYLNISKSLANGTSIGEYTVSQKDVDHEFLEYAQNNIDLSNIDLSNIDLPYSIDDKYLTVHLPVLHNNGDEIGFFLVAEKIEVASELLRKNRKLVLTLIFVISLLIIISVLVQLSFIQVNIIKPVKQFSNIFSNMARGNFSGNTDVSKTSLLGDLAESNNTMINNLKKFIIEMQATSTLTEQSQKKLVYGIEHTVSDTNDIIYNTLLTSQNVDELQNSINESTNAINLIDRSINSLALRIEDQSASISQTTASLEEMSASIKGIADIAKEKNKSTRNLISYTTNGADKITKTVTIIDDIGKSIVEMLQLINLIDNVSEETNLLAMNAAIEAAHAGDAGKGFAVVAGEIKKLAESTKHSSTRIALTLNELANKIRSAVDSSRDTKSAFKDIKLSAAELIEALTEIESSTNELEVNSVEVVDTSENMVQITTDVESSIDDITQHMSVITDLISHVSVTSKSVMEHIHVISHGSIEINKSMGKITTTSIETVSNIEEHIVQLQNFKVSDEMELEQKHVIKRLHLSKVILMHNLLITKARGYIDKVETIDSASDLDHNQCLFGRWLNTSECKLLFKPQALLLISKNHGELHKILKKMININSTDKNRDLLESMLKDMITCSKIMAKELSKISV